MKRTGWIIFVAVILLIGTALYFLSRSTGKQYDWNPNYKNSSNQPYGFQLLFNVLKSEFPGQRFIEVKKPLRENADVLLNQKDALYFIAGGQLYLDSASEENIMEFVSEGNTAFFATQYIPFNIYQRIFEGKFHQDSLTENDYNDYNYYSNTSVFEDSVVHPTFIHPQLHDTGDTLSLSFQYEWKKNLINWDYYYFRTKEADFDSVISLGVLNEQYVNFIRVKYGKGYIYLCCTPLAFTNFYLNHESGYNYFKKVFSNFHATTLIWDEASKLPYYDWKSKPYAEESPLKFILGNRSLRWAWYLLLFMVLLFIIFRAKRVQKIIPVTEPNLNTSLEFVQTVGRLYFLQNDHHALAKQKFKLFLLFVRNRYKILLKDFTEDEIKKLSVKSEINREQVKHIFITYKIIQKQTNITANELIEFHRYIDHFYKNCK